MVGKIQRSSFLLSLVAVLLLVLAFVPTAGAQGLENEEAAPLQEEYRMEINDVGDAHITDTLAYDPVWFDEYGYIFEENPNLLTRRYRADSNVGEVENFNVDVDSNNSTITVSFDTPGLAYNFGDGWDIYGYGSYSAVSENTDMVTLQASWVLSNEFTLFETMPLDETVIIDLPVGTTEASFDEGKGTVTYGLPYEAEGAGVLADNKTVFLFVFALIMALSLLLLAFALTRPTSAPPAAAAVGVVPPVTPGAPTTGVPPYPPAPPPVAPPETSAGPGEAPSEQKFCKQCGKPRSKPDQHFCSDCGTPFE
jgi:hypothetical protein